MLRYRIEGSGEPLLLIHGWGVTYATWHNLVPLLTPYFQLVMIELPGFGGSPGINTQQPYYPACAEALDELRRILRIERWSVLAYSSGTRVAEVYIQRYVQHITCAVFLCPIYLSEWLAFALRVLDNTRPRREFQLFTHWLFSDWRLYTLVLMLGFNGQRHDYTRLWKDEIELQSLDVLLRILCELPDKGRAPFSLPAVPTLFVWGNRDTLTARPRHPCSNDVFIEANHSAPMLAAPSVAQVVTPFLREGVIVRGNMPVSIEGGSSSCYQQVQSRAKIRSMIVQHTHIVRLLRERMLRRHSEQA